MRVISGIADVDFHVGSVERVSGGLVVRSRAGQGIPTAVHVSALDIVEAIKAVLVSPRALLFLLTAPFRSRRTESSGLRAATSSGAEDDINNPWI